MGVLWPNGSTIRPPISSDYGPRRAPVPGASTFHRGVDFVGYSQVRAVAAGQVVAIGTPAGWSGGGTQVWVQHDGFLTRSMHLASVGVRNKQFVRVGDALGPMGRTGNVSGVHHHLEVVVNGVQVDPVPFITARIAAPAGGGSSSTVQEDDMPTMSEFLNYPAYTGGPMISEFFKAVDTGGVASQVWGRAVDRGLDAAGKPVLIPALQELADVKTIVMQLRASQAGLEAALHALANAKGLDADAILSAAQAGVETALRKVTFTADIG